MPRRPQAGLLRHVVTLEHKLREAIAAQHSRFPTLLIPSTIGDLRVTVSRPYAAHPNVTTAAYHTTNANTRREYLGYITQHGFRPCRRVGLHAADKVQAVRMALAAFTAKL